jgi:S-methylmethionine-dependent homocysteine/selenocysteine methylase
MADGRRNLMALFRKYVSASASVLVEPSRQKREITLWVPSYLSSGKAATHVFIHTSESECTRYHGIEILMEANMKIPLAAHETLYGITEDQAIVGIATEDI